MPYIAYVLSLFTLAIGAVFAQETIREDETIEVIGVTPTHGVGLPEKLVPYHVQSSSHRDIEDSQALDLTDFLKRRLGSVTVNDAQNNPLQVDLQYRGYTLSPLLGLPQGLAVFQDGVRINEPFGDTMNWDLIPESAIADINLIGGANPVFGLNTLGGALSITTKNGFTHSGHNIEVYGGSFERVVATLESGGNNDNWGYFLTTNYFDEEGWRDVSPSDALNLFSAVSYRSTDTTLDLTYNHADTDLIGNGASPEELLGRDRSAVFTSPDRTENSLNMVNLSGTHWISNNIQISGNAFYRHNETNSFNGDGSEFEECDVQGSNPDAITGEFLFELEEELDMDCEAMYNSGSGEYEDQDGNEIELVKDQNDEPIEAENSNGTERNAVNNISDREQEGFGINLQTTLLGDLFGRKNQFIIGSAYQQGLIDFFSRIEVATLNCEFNGEDCGTVNANRGTTGSGKYVVEEGTKIKAHNRVVSVYITDTLSVTDRFSITASARYNNAHIVLGDRSGESNLADPANPAELNGEHDFERINPAVGFTYALTDDDGIYGSYSESSRAPTPVELLCAHEDAPCNLPNAFLADPPLEQVVTKSFEGGLRGILLNNIAYNISGFHSVNNDDIIFGSTGGVASNEGFFRNVGDTRRLGAELGLSGVFQEHLQWYANYSYVSATFEDPFLAVSASHPNAGSDGRIQVESGDRIPGIPEHSIKLGGVYAFNDRLSIGANMIYNSDQVLRGDESNELDTVDRYVVFNLNGRFKINDSFFLFARVNNLFDTDYETFGLLGEGDEVEEILGSNYGDISGRFLGPGTPINGFFGVTMIF